MTNHVPTPEFNSYTSRIQEKPLVLVSNGNAEKCQPSIIKGSCLEIRVSRAEDFGDPKPDAAFIVRAVNAHGLLLETAKQAMADLGDCKCSGHKCLFCLAQEAIAKAEEK